MKRDSFIYSQIPRGTVAHIIIDFIGELVLKVHLTYKSTRSLPGSRCKYTRFPVRFCRATVIRKTCSRSTHRPVLKTSDSLLTKRVLHLKK